MMVAYSFQKRFAAPIILGTKRQTIRADRKRHAYPNEMLQLYTGMRTKHCRKIGLATCSQVDRITMQLGAKISTIFIEEGTGGKTTIFPSGLDEFARCDGFDDWPQMLHFWELNHGDLPTFTGVLIRWTAFRSEAAQ